MRPGIYGKKVGMTQIFDENGTVVPVTVIDASECVITQIKTKQTDGYNAIQVGYGFRKPQNATKAITGHVKKAGVPAKANFSELRFEDDADLTQYKPGQALSVSMFIKGDIVDIVGTSRGKGFAGVFKRYGWHGADATHGASKYFRHGGSNGTNTFPGKVLKNKGMPGQLGNQNATTSGLRIVDVLADKNLILVKGAVPGSKGNYVKISNSVRRPAPEGRSLVSA